MWEFFLELLREYGLAVVVIGLSFAGMVAIIVALWRRNREQAKTIEAGGAASKLDEILDELVSHRGDLTAIHGALDHLPEIQDLLEARYETRIAFLEGQIRELLEENRELQRKWREQASADLREMLGHVNANREVGAKICAAVTDIKELLRR